MNKPMLSIVVPTKNRHTFLKSFIETIAEFDCTLCEIIIQDNSIEIDGFDTWLSKRGLPHVRYYNEPIPVPIVVNADRAILSSIGEYVCFMGDDDSVSRYILDLVRHMKEHDIDSARCTKAEYKWPGVVHRAHNFPNLTIPKYSGRITEIDPAHERLKCFRSGAGSLWALPMAYHAIVSRDILDKVYASTGSFFPGASPDMANAIALSYFSRSHVYVDAPFVTSGHSPSSGGGLGARHAHTGKLKDMPHLPANIEQIWDARIPMIWSWCTIWAQSAISAMQALGRENDLAEFNFSFLYANFIHESPRRNPKMVNELKAGRQWLAILRHIIEIAWTRGRKFISNFLYTNFSITSAQLHKDIPTSHQASLIIDENLYANRNLFAFALTN